MPIWLCHVTNKILCCILIYILLIHIALWSFFAHFSARCWLGVTSISEVFIGDLIAGSEVNWMGTKGGYCIKSDGHVMVFFQSDYVFISFDGCTVHIGLSFLVF